MRARALTQQQIVGGHLPSPRVKPMKPRLDVNLKDLTNYKIGGRIKYFYETDSIEDIKGALDLAKKERVAFFIIGGGTNLLPSDDGFSGVVIKPALRHLKLEGDTVDAGAGIAIKDLLEFAVEHSLTGLEWAGGLPGTLGGAIRGNAGAFSGEIKDSILEVTSLDTKSAKIVARTCKECNFSYRNSVFKSKGDEIILSAKLKLGRGDKESIKKSIQEKVDFRNSRHPLDLPNAGSIFKNVDVASAPKGLLAIPDILIKDDPFPVIPAAHLIGRAGLKGVKEGGAMVSTKHANFIVNFDNATSEDVMNLIAKVKKEVKDRFGVELEEEILIL